MSRSAGYSGRPLHAKLGLKPEMRACALNAPDHYPDLLAAGGDPVHLPDRTSAGMEFVHLFVTERAALETGLPALLEEIARDGMIWVSWPKKASGVSTDIREDAIREIALPLGLVDVKVCAVDEVWSGLKLMIRKELR